MNEIKLGEVFEERIKILKDFDEDGRPITEDGIIKWTIISIHHADRYFRAVNKYGEKKYFLLE